MKILYIHGFGSQFDPTHEKIQLLETLGTVIGVNVDYTKGFNSVFNTVVDEIANEKVDLVIGTSMGGYMAAHCGAAAGIPFVSLNPAPTPSETLMKWVGTFTDFAGNDLVLSKNTVLSYPEISMVGCGLIIVESSDEIIKASDTVEKLEGVFKVVVFKGGSHRFTHMANALPLILEHYEHSQTSYGV